MGACSEEGGWEGVWCLFFQQQGTTAPRLLVTASSPKGCCGHHMFLEREGNVPIMLKIVKEKGMGIQNKVIEKCKV